MIPTGERDETTDGLPAMVKAEKVAKWLQLADKKDVYLMVHRGEIPQHCYLHIGRRLRFLVRELRSWLAEKRVPSRESAR